MTIGPEQTEDVELYSDNCAGRARSGCEITKNISNVGWLQIKPFHHSLPLINH